jgi:germination protein M
MNVISRKGKFLAVVCLVVLTIIALAGCKPEPEKKTTKKVTAKQDADSKESQKTKGQEDKPKTKTVNVYFSDANSEYLVPEQREVFDSTTATENTLEELVKGPKEEGHLATIPEGTEIKGVTVSGEVVAVNFSRAFVDNHPGGSASELMTVYSVVDTVTEVAGVDRVRFLVEGQALESLAGHLDLTQPIERDDSLIKR